MDCGCGMLQPRVVAREEKGFSTVSPKSFVNGVAEQQTVIENGDLRLFRCRDQTVDVNARQHSSRARSQSKRCFSVFGNRRGTSISGSRPKLIFIGAKCFCGVETYRHSAPIAVSAGSTIGSLPRAVRTALMPATRPDAIFSM